MLTVGVIVIGRNEGERLKKCLDSLEEFAGQVVYVDSGSTDGSVEMASVRGINVLSLQMDIPFTAARARNAGYARLRELVPDLAYLQFVDGDCTIAEGWLDSAAMFLAGHSDVAAVSGRLRERFPKRSIYNMLCDMEWDTPVGEARACGGIAMMRVTAFEAVRGFRDDIIAGEEPELCVRLRASGWRIWHLAGEMAIHDAAMLHFRQWWVRTMRAGHAFAQGASLHGDSPQRHYRRETRSAWFWGLVVPVAILGFALWGGAWALLLLSIYPLQVVRLAVIGKRARAENWWRAAFLVLGKFPEMLGQLKFLMHRQLGEHTRLIEYK
jgi:GT2 family glycosyltransferase